MFGHNVNTITDLAQEYSKQIWIIVSYAIAYDDGDLTEYMDYINDAIALRASVLQCVEDMRKIA